MDNNNSVEDLREVASNLKRLSEEIAAVDPADLVNMQALHSELEKWAWVMETTVMFELLRARAKAAYAFI